MNPQLWNSWLPGVPMPDGLTFEEFVEVREQLYFKPMFEDMDRELEKLMEGQNDKNIQRTAA